MRAAARRPSGDSPFDVARIVWKRQWTMTLTQCLFFKGAREITRAQLTSAMNVKSGTVYYTWKVMHPAVSVSLITEAFLFLSRRPLLQATVRSRRAFAVPKAAVAACGPAPVPCPTPRQTSSYVHCGAAGALHGRSWSCGLRGTRYPPLLPLHIIVL